MNRFDYSWAIGLVIVLALALMWKPIVGSFHSMADKATNKEQYQRGKAVFYNVEQWGGAGSYKSCAMCHAADFVPDPDKQITMSRYKAGQPVILQNMSSKYGGSMLGTGDELYEACNRCIQAPDKIASGRISPKVPFMEDLLFYIGKL